MNDTVTKRDVFEMCSTPGRFSGVLLGLSLCSVIKKKKTFQKHRNIKCVNLYSCPWNVRGLLILHIYQLS